jgi:hypothetical protein
VRAVPTPAVPKVTAPGFVLASAIRSLTEFTGISVRNEHKTFVRQGRSAMSSETNKPTLYERLGGVYSIAAVVDDFIDRVMHNPVLNANAAVDEAHHRVSAAGFKYYVTEMVC